jgi:bacillolysin
MVALNSEQITKLERLRLSNPELHYEAHEFYRVVASLSGLSSEQIIEPPIDKSALASIRAYQDLFGINDVRKELKHPVLSTDPAGWTHVTYEQYHEGIRVWSGCITAHIDPQKRLHSISNNVKLNFPNELKPKIDQKAAIEMARESGHHDPKDHLLQEPRLFIYPDESPALIWVLALSGLQPSYESSEMLPGAWLYFVDAISGNIIRRTPLVKEVAQTSPGLSISDPPRLTQVTRTLQTWHNDDNNHDELLDTITGTADHVEIRTNNNGVLSWDDAPVPAGDNNWNRTTGETSTGNTVAILDQRRQYQPAEVDAHHFGGEIYRFWRRAPFNRNSFDNAGCAIVLNTHPICHDQYGNRVPCHSAGWNGSRIQFGDSDGILYTFKSGQLDVFAHESTHAVMGSEVLPNGLTYCGQSGAAEESFCDVFGAFAEHNWLFEEQIVRPPHSCLRNLADPGDPNALEPGHDHYADYVSSADPCGHADPHRNCHILNYACYLMTHGGVHRRATRTPADIPVYPGIDWTAAETIYYRALTEGFTANPGLGTDSEQYFAEVRRQVLLAAEWAYGHGSCAYKTARLAFYAIGLQPTIEPYGPDVAVTPWGYVTHEGPTWQSPDFFVRDVADNPVEPARGVHNRLFIRVCNIGDQTATSVRVRALYAPHSLTYHHEDFKEIALSPSFSLNSGQQQEVEFDWNLTNLNENNGGLWPAAGGLAGIRGYDHFCVRAEIECEADANSCNNVAQNNFTNVPLDLGDTDDTAFLVFSPQEEECWGEIKIDRHLPRTWKVGLQGIDSLKKVRLSPKEPTLIRLKVTASASPALEPPIDGEIEGTFGPRLLTTRRIALRKLGKFHAQLKVEKYYSRRKTFSGQLNGILDRTGQHFSGKVHGQIVDDIEMTVAGMLEGHVLGENWIKHEPIKIEFKGQLQPWRDVSVSMNVPGAPTTGITLRFLRK